MKLSPVRTDVVTSGKYDIVGLLDLYLDRLVDGSGPRRHCPRAALQRRCRAVAALTARRKVGQRQNGTYHG